MFYVNSIMGHFVYIIYSASHDIYYKGYSEDPIKRVKDHNLDLSRYTAGKGPWELVYTEEYPTKREALIREKALKKCKKEYFLWLIQNKKNG